MAGNSLMGGMAGAAAATPTPTNCLLLENLVQEDMLKDDEEYADVCEDIKEVCECAGKGAVIKVSQSAQAVKETECDVPWYLCMHAHVWHGCAV
jgi:hypothetical protein